METREKNPLFRVLEIETKTDRNINKRNRWRKRWIDKKNTIDIGVEINLELYKKLENLNALKSLIFTQSHYKGSYPPGSLFLKMTVSWGNVLFLEFSGN